MFTVKSNYNPSVNRNRNMCKAVKPVFVGIPTNGIYLYQISAKTNYVCFGLITFNI